VTWFPIDFVDEYGAGHTAIVFKADAYEDHWLEVVRVENSIARTIFSGLGYYL
jgi:hypothetical protein